MSRCRTGNDASPRPGTAARVRRRKNRRLVVDHEQPVQESLLWLRDAVCGAEGHRHCGDARLYALIEDQVTIVEMELT